MKRLILGILITVIWSNLFAQLQNIPLITVIGESVEKVKPDFVIIGLKITKKLSMVNGIKPILEIFKDEEINLKLFDFNDKDISKSLTFLNHDSIYNKEIFITINDLTKLDKYLLELFNLGFRDYLFMDYRIKNYNDIKNKVRKEAMHSAQTKAVLLANEMGQSIGKAHTIEELYSDDYNWYNGQEKELFSGIMVKEGNNGYTIEPGFVSVTSKIRISFDLLK